MRIAIHVFVAAVFSSLEIAQAVDAKDTQSPLISAHQAERVGAAVEQTAPQMPGSADVFFLGFAGYGEQKVFRNEEEFARRVFAERFGSGSRSVALVNDSADRDSFPFATVSNLHWALELIGRKMDREEDVLVLMLTSHGSRQEGLVVTNGEIALPALNPTELKQALDDSGIRWRVIVISACFAGVFIKPLKNDTTLIVTASDARHSSFGCADDRDLTYFGEALLQDALPKASSLEAAFQRAREIVRKREKAEGEAHSNPQLFVGSKMRAKLATLESAKPNTH